MTTLTIRAKRPPTSTFRTPRTTFGLDPQAHFQGGIDGSFAPAFEIREYADHFELQADVPGVDPASLGVFIDAGWVTVLGRRTPSTDTSDCLGYRMYERGFGSFWRAFYLLPTVTCAGARAELSDGVLMLFVPKCEPSEGLGPRGEPGAETARRAN